MITQSQIDNDKEWIRSLKNLYFLCKEIDNRYYVYENYVCHSKGSIFLDIKKRRENNKSYNKEITTLENGLEELFIEQILEL